MQPCISGIRTPNFVGHPARNFAIVGEIQGHEYRQYDLTPQQYDSLIKLTADRGYVAVRKEGTEPSEVLPDVPKGRTPKKLSPKDLKDSEVKM